MSRTIVIDNNKPFEAVLSLNLYLYVGTNVITRLNAKDTIVLLRQLPNVDLIILRPQIDEEFTLALILEYLKKNKLFIPIIVMGAVELAKDDQLCQVIDDWKNWRRIVRYSARTLGVTAKDMVEKKLADYYPINIRYFLPIKRSICDVYLKIKDGNDTQFIKRINAKEEYERSLILKYKENGVEEFFIEKDYRLRFVNDFTDMILARLDEHNLKYEERARLTGDLFDVVQDQIAEIGLNPQSVQLASAAIKSMGNVIKQCKDLSKLMMILENDKMGYLYKHSLLISVIGHELIGKMDWGSRELQDKLIFVSFFHDITLRDERLLKIHTESQLNNSNLSDEDKLRVQKHALNSSALLRDYPDVPLGAEIIIQQHHGQKNGVGFPDFYSSNISPLSAIFCVVEDFVNFIFEQKPSFADGIWENYFQILKNKYPSGNYKKAVESLRAIRF